MDDLKAALCGMFLIITLFLEAALFPDFNRIICFILAAAITFGVYILYMDLSKGFKNLYGSAKDKPK